MIMKKNIHFIMVLIMTCFIQQVFAQNLSVNGKITDGTGTELTGVSVFIKGSTTGTSSDPNGNYSINVPTNGAVLVFSYVGMVKKEIPVNSSGVINVIMEDEAGSLEDVVIVGYGTQRRASVTGSIATVNTKALLKSTVGYE